MKKLYVNIFLVPSLYNVIISFFLLYAPFEFNFNLLSNLFPKKKEEKRIYRNFTYLVADVREKPGMIMADLKFKNNRIRLLVVNL